MAYRIFGGFSRSYVFDCNSVDLNLFDTGHTFENLDNALGAVEALFQDPFSAIEIRDGDTVVWQSRNLRERNEASLVSPGTPEFVAAAHTELDKALGPLGFSYGDWRVEFTLQAVKTKTRYFEPYSINLVVTATNGRQTNRATLRDIVSASGSLQRARFNAAMPDASTAWRELRAKPAPGHGDLVAHVHDRLLHILPRLRHYTDRQLLMHCFYGDIAHRSALYVLWQMMHRLGRAETPYPSPYGNRELLATLEAEHACGCGSQELLLPAANDTINVTLNGTGKHFEPGSASAIASIYCCETAAVIDLLKFLIIRDTNRAYYQIGIRSGAGYKLIHTAHEELVMLQPFLETDDWFAIRCCSPYIACENIRDLVQGVPDTFRGAGLDPGVDIDRFDRLASTASFTSRRGNHGRLMPRAVKIGGDGMPVFAPPTLWVTNKSGGEMICITEQVLADPNTLRTLLDFVNEDHELVTMVDEAFREFTCEASP